MLPAATTKAATIEWRPIPGWPWFLFGGSVPDVSAELARGAETVANDDDD